MTVSWISLLMEKRHAVTAMTGVKKAVYGVVTYKFLIKVIFVMSYVFHLLVAKLDLLTLEIQLNLTKIFKK